MLLSKSSRDDQGQDLGSKENQGLEVYLEFQACMACLVRRDEMVYQAYAA
jgi:hypothetical protein